MPSPWRPGRWRTDAADDGPGRFQELPTRVFAPLSEDFLADSGGYDQLGFGTPPLSTSASASGDLAATGSDDIVGRTATTGITALAGGLLLLRRRDRARRASE
ncbi:hypothetical protein ACWCPI_15915 [Streptomyces sp. NPDC001920]